MAGCQMPSNHQAAPTAFQADDVIPMNGSADRHRGSSLTADFWWLFTETCEGLMNSRDQGPELIGRDLIAPNICGDNLSREFSIDGGGWCFVGHINSPETDQIPYPVQKRDDVLGSPLKYYVASLTSFLFPV